MDSGRNGLEPNAEIMSLGWDDLIALKRKLSNELKDQSSRLVEIDQELGQSIQSSIRRTRGEMETVLEQSRQNKDTIEKQNTSLMSVSQKISQSKNFLSLMQTRMPSENEHEINAITQFSQMQLDKGEYKGEREKGELLSRLKDASMKLEAIKATRMVSDQLALLTDEAAQIKNSIIRLETEREKIRELLARSNSKLDELYDSKRRLAAEKESLLAFYMENLKRFEAINLRLDSMAEMRKRQREEYGYALPSDALFKVKESARKKLEAGSKLSFDELKLLYEDKE